MTSINPFAGWTAASPYAVVLVGAALLCVVCAFATWRRRPLPGAAQGTVVLMAAAVWALFYAFELTAGGLSGRVVWAKSEYLGIAVVPVAWFVFARSYTGAARPFKRWWLAGLYVVPLITLVLACTNDLHGLLWSDVSLSTTGPFPHLLLARGAWFWVHVGYSYLFMALGSVLLVVGAYRSGRPNVFGRQVGLLLLAAAMPWIGNLLYLIQVLPYEGVLDPTPVAFAVAGMLVTLNLSRFRLFSLQPALLPIAKGQLLQQMNDGMLVLDAGGRIAYANPAVCSMLGTGQSDLVGKLPEELPSELSAWLQWSPKESREERFDITLGDGAQIRDYDVVASVICHGARGNWDGIGRLLVLRDVTEHKKAELALRQGEERLRSLSSMATEGVMIHEEGVIVDANSAFAHIAGQRTVDDLIGKIGLEVVPFTDGSRRQVAEHMHSDSADTYEVQLVRHDGSVFWAETSGRRVTHGGRPARLVLMRDINERKQAEEALSSRTEQLRQSQKTEAVGRLAGGIAHDFNNMLGVILGHAEVALTQVSPSESVYKDILEISRAAKRSAGITQQLLGFARQQMAVPIKLDLNDGVQAMVHMLDRLVGEDVELVWKPGNALGMVLMDPSQLDQILVNLCVNARDAIASGGQVVIETAQVHLDDPFCATRPGCEIGDYARLTLSDTGCGMQEETLKHVFEPFFTTKDPGKGTGLGLATVYGIVKQNGGYIEVDSEPDQGTRIDIYLPSQAAAETSEERPDSLGVQNTGSEVLLLVEDEISLLRLSERVLTGLGYTVLASDTPAEALLLAESHLQELALVVTDVIMPEMNGRELVESLRALRPGLKALYISGYAAEVISDRGILEDGVFFLQKPYTPQELAGHVRSALGVPRHAAD